MTAHVDFADADTSWMDSANCAGFDPDLFFPEIRSGASASLMRSAKAVCAGCEVRGECLEFALVTNQLHGCWGGTSPRERRKLRVKAGMA